MRRGHWSIPRRPKWRRGLRQRECGCCWDFSRHRQAQLVRRDAALDDALAEFYERLLASQAPPPGRAMEIMSENLWALYG